jgi:hypothetical protein
LFLNYDLPPKRGDVVEIRLHNFIRKSTAVISFFSPLQRYAVSQFTRSLRIITAGLFVALIKVSSAPVVIGIGIIRFQAYGFIKILNGKLIPA